MCPLKGGIPASAGIWGAELTLHCLCAAKSHQAADLTGITAPLAFGWPLPPAAKRRPAPVAAQHRLDTVLTEFQPTAATAAGKAASHHLPGGSCRCWQQQTGGKAHAKARQALGHHIRNGRQRDAFDSSRTWSRATKPDMMHASGRQGSPRNASPISGWYFPSFHLGVRVITGGMHRIGELLRMELPIHQRGYPLSILFNGLDMAHTCTLSWALLCLHLVLQLGSEEHMEIDTFARRAGRKPQQ